MEEFANTPVVPGVYLGSRGEDFKMLIENILKTAGIKQKYIDYLLDSETVIDGKYTAFQLFCNAFTSSENIDPENNYQFLEQLGDLTANKFLVKYASDRFPQLKCAEGVKVLARIRINYGSKQSFYPIAEKLGFWPFISSTCDERIRRRKSLLEDVLEAFLGAIEYIIDSVGFGGSKGYSICCIVLGWIFDNINISIRYEDLFDAKTRIKEVFDMFSTDTRRPIGGTLYYENFKDNMINTSKAMLIDNLRPRKEMNFVQDEKEMIVYDVVDRTRPTKKIELGRGSASLKIDAEQKAASEALKKLASMGFVKHTPSLYLRFSDPSKKNDEIDVLKICGDEKSINEQFFTKGKSKHQTKYTSTVLIHCCRQANLSAIKKCIELGANPNLTDSDGLTATDVLMIVCSQNKDLLKQCLKELRKQVPNKLKVHSNVFSSCNFKFKKSLFEIVDEYIGIEVNLQNKPKRN